jgi:hypothetical protein
MVGETQDVIWTVAIGGGMVFLTLTYVRSKERKGM